MELLRLKIKNFKGIDNLEVEPFGEDTVIFGDNETGKTSIGDAYSWLLTGKDSLGNHNFEIKNKDDFGEGVNHEVEAEFAENGEPFTLKKSFRETWTKKRGSAKPVMTGNTTDHYIDGDIVTQKEFDAALADITDKETMQILINPLHFSKKLKEDRRRSILMSLIEGVSNEDVAASDPKFKEVLGIMGKRTREKCKKNISTKQKKVNEKIKEVPARIDEAKTAIVKVEKSEATLKALIASHEKNLSKKEAELNRVENGAESIEKSKELSKVEGKIIKAENELNRTHETAKTEKHTAMLKAKSSMDNAINVDNDRIELSAELEVRIADETKDLTALKKEHGEVRAKEFEPTESDNCPTCGQEIPENQIEEANQKALEAFNLKKSQRLSDIASDGREANKFITENGKDLEKLRSEMKAAQSEIESLEKTYLDAMSEYEGLAEPEPSDELKELRKNRAEIQAEIDSLDKDSAPKVDKLTKEIDDIKERIDERKDQELQHKQNKKQKDRIKELKEQEKVLAAEYEKLEHHLYLIEEFTRAKVAMLDEQINSHFKLCKWRLTEEQINGGLKDACIVTTLDGVGYGSMNNAMRVNIGLEICQVIAKHKGVTLPVVIDNAESVTHIYKTDAQQIKLVVSEPDKALRVEVAGDTKKKAA